MKTKPKTIGMLAEWIMANRKGDAFKDDTLSSLVCGLEEDASYGNMLYVLDDDVHFIGVVTFIPDRANRLLFVKNILVTKTAALVIFAQHFKRMFDGYTIMGNQNNKEVMYNTHRLINHLLGMKGNS